MYGYIVHVIEVCLVIYVSEKNTHVSVTKNHDGNRTGKVRYTRNRDLDQ